MNVSTLVAALVLRVGRPEGFDGLAWAPLGQLFDLTQDQIRHRLAAFKKKYNVVDDDAKQAGWARRFLAENTPEAEKSLLEEADYYPGEVVIYDDGFAVITEVVDGEEYTLVEIQDTGYTIHYGLDAELFTEIDPIEEKKVGAAKFNQPSSVVKKTDVKKQTEPLQHLITPNCLIVVRDGVPLTIDKSHKNYDKIGTALAAKEWQSVLDLIDLKNTLTKYSNGRVKVENGAVTFDGQKVHGKIVDRLLNSLLEENTEALEALANFIVKTDDNPDHRVVTRIFDFIAAKDIRLDKDGDFYAYKVVRSDYNDKHSNTMSNRPGLTVKMKRNQVNPNDAQTCSHGLHVCSKSYISHFSGGGDRVVLTKVNPRDVVSVPNDYGDAKMRTCEYYVVKDCTENFVDEDNGTAIPKA